MAWGQSIYGVDVRYSVIVHSIAYSRGKYLSIRQNFPSHTHFSSKSGKGEATLLSRSKLGSYWPGSCWDCWTCPTSTVTEPMQDDCMPSPRQLPCTFSMLRKFIFLLRIIILLWSDHVLTCTIITPQITSQVGGMPSIHHLQHRTICSPTSRVQVTTNLYSSVQHRSAHAQGVSCGSVAKFFGQAYTHNFHIIELSLEHTYFQGFNFLSCGFYDPI